MEEYAEDDEELRDKFRDLKINTRPNQIISNVVFENEKMRRECKYLQNEMQRLRKILLNPGLKYDKLDDRLLTTDLKDISDKTDPENYPKNQMVPIPVGEEGMRMDKTNKPQMALRERDMPFKSK